MAEHVHVTLKTAPVEDTSTSTGKSGVMSDGLLQLARLAMPHAASVVMDSGNALLHACVDQLNTSVTTDIKKIDAKLDEILKAQAKMQQQLDVIQHESKQAHCCGCVIC